MGFSAGTLTAIQGASTVAGGYASAQWGSTQNDLAEADARASRAAGIDQARMIMRDTARVRGAARGATAASGVRIDEFSLPIENDITQAGTMDATMAILDGNQRAGGLELQGRMQRRAGRQAMFSSLLDVVPSAVKAWRGAMHTEHQNKLRDAGNSSAGAA